MVPNNSIAINESGAIFPFPIYDRRHQPDAAAHNINAVTNHDCSIYAPTHNESCIVREIIAMEQEQEQEQELSG